MDNISFKDFNVIFAKSSGRHGYSKEDIVYVVEHVIRQDNNLLSNGSVLIKLVGSYHDPLVPRMEIVMTLRPNMTLLIHHAAALTDNFWDR
jgi:hypothetical protein